VACNETDEHVDISNILQLAAAAEASSEHPLAHAITDYVRNTLGLSIPSSVDVTVRICMMSFSMILTC